MKRLIGVVTCHRYQYPTQDEGAAHHSGANELRANAIRNTWYRIWKERYSDQIDLKFFLGRAARAPQENEIFLDCADDYYSLPAKVQNMLGWARDNGYDDTLKLDDDVWLYVDRLLSDFQSTDYKGFVLESADGAYTSGTAYWLNRQSMQTVANATWNPAEWAEDKWVGRVLSTHGIKPVHDERYQCCHCDHCSHKFPEDSRISSHVIDPRRMYELMEKNYGCFNSNSR